ncbi:MAG: 2-hydroxyglutaryl-CoA dehydratase [Bacteroidetes bacterium]|mgnify:CR=1 FL=1|jgi:(R)-2-hydroxyacyl-CoA dehydratese activating ATPase|nr:2-hydroxyglutaryl-CoA dehydratase [Bacteroidota bacterium]MBT6685080.1 2-hydroxyglutaryl-CoA dehydratase [Bacteroidota bacterium]MBT7142616.1 2-hydroxyglutaryl-CoA dehydratase [Bacteroidota bacterium]MBT7493541.1 2-hydroxyglutaryl-CoA dehydratase [Bacteroidota bacterium]
MRILGIDLGSRQVKIVIMEDSKIIFTRVENTMNFYRNYCTYNGKINVDLEKLSIENIDVYISTGYGKNNTDLSNFTPINEIKAHVYGAIFQTGMKDFILFDIGGQDVKVVKVEKGIITDLDLNEKCAASCGRYLENMANILEVSTENLSKYSENPVELNSTCAVFSESELIGKIAEGAQLEELCAGVNFSLYSRLKPFINKFRDNQLILSGGVAKNKAIQNYFSNDYSSVHQLESPEFNGAIGCCSFGKKMKLEIGISRH